MMHRPSRGWLTLLLVAGLSACVGHVARAERPPNDLEARAGTTWGDAVAPPAASEPPGVDEDIPSAPSLGASEAPSARPGGAPLVALALPMSGGGRRLGQNLELVARQMEATEPPGTLRIAYVDAHAPEAEGTWSSLRQQGAVGIVLVTPDRAMVAAWVERARGGGPPLVVLANADEAVTSPGQAWRAIHGAKVVARTLAGAAVARGARRVGIIASDSPTDDGSARLLKAALKAAGAEVAFEVRHPVATPDWAATSKQVKAAVDEGVEALALLEPPLAASQLLAHLARQGVWSSGVPDVPKGQRSVLILGTPEWDDPALLAQSARYFEGALVPSPFASETPAGALMKARLLPAGLRVTALDALIWESVTALASAGRPGGPALSASPAAQWTSGLDFSGTDALKRLFVLQFVAGKLVPAR